MTTKWNANKWTRSNDRTMPQVANLKATGSNSFRMIVMERRDKRLNFAQIWIPIHQSQRLFPLDDWWIGRILQDWKKYTGQQIWDGVTPMQYEFCFYSLYDLKPFRSTGKFVNPNKNYVGVFNKQVKSAL